MHLPFLGVTESNFKLINRCLKETPGPGEETFEKNTQELLKVLTKFNLSWPLTLPFSGSKKTKLTTGTRVSENHLAFFLDRKSGSFLLPMEDAERRGGNNVTGMVAFFAALVARVMSHAGTTPKRMCLVDLLAKEFLSCVRELDAFVQHKQIAQATSFTNTTDDPGTGRTGKKNDEAWWMKSNCMSLPNLAPLMVSLGPLVDFWDGGGCGERHIQEIKPQMPRGVRDGGLFFVRLLEKVFKLDSLQRTEEACTVDENVKVDMDCEPKGSAVSIGSDVDSIGSDVDSDGVNVC